MACHLLGAEPLFEPMFHEYHTVFLLAWHLLWLRLYLLYIKKSILYIQYTSVTLHWEIIQRMGLVGLNQVSFRFIGSRRNTEHAFQYILNRLINCYKLKLVFNSLVNFIGLLLLYTKIMTISRQILLTQICWISTSNYLDTILYILDADRLIQGYWVTYIFISELCHHCFR